MVWPFNGRRDRELDDEVRAHLEMAERDRLERGETPANARAHARREFGNIAAITQTARELGGWPIVDAAAHDLRHALRRLWSRPAGAVLAVALLGLAIGVSSAMFTVLDALILRPVPYRDPETLVWLAMDGNVNLATSLVKFWRQFPEIASVYGVMQRPVQFGAGEEAQTESGVLITPGLFEELGARPLAGRTFSSDEGGPGTDDVAIISETVWRSRYAGDPNVVGRRVEMSGVSVLVIGIMPASFTFPAGNTRIWKPLDLDRPPTSRGSPSAWAYARLSAKVPREDVTPRLTAVTRAADPTLANQSVTVRPLLGVMDAYSAGIVRILASGVGLVFLVLCANVANLMLARFGARRREFALCSALGASRARLLHQAMGEQFVIGISAGVVGLAVGAALVSVARAFLPTDIVYSTLNRLDVDIRAVLATSVLSGMAIFLAGILPAWLGTRADPSSQLQRTSRSATTERGARRMITALLVAEIALAVALAVGAGIQLRSFVNLLHEDYGFDMDRLATFEIAFPAERFADGSSRYAAIDRARSGIQELPGIEETTASSGAMYFYDVRADLPGATPVKLAINGYYVTPGFLRTKGIRLLEGRDFQPSDPPETVIVSRSMAAALWPATSPVGHTMTFVNSRTFRVIGVASEVRNPMHDPRDDQPEMYEPLLSPGPAEAAGPVLPFRAVTLTVRCGPTCPPLDLVRARIKSTNPGLLVWPGKRVRDGYVEQLERPRTGAVIAIAFATIALLAVGAGLFAVLTRAAQQRQREFGIRLALGATPADLWRLVHFSGLRIAAAGLAVGSALAWTFGRVLASVQYQVRLDDPLTWIAVIGTISVTALLAAWRPARQAMRLDPIALLRDE